MATFRAVIDVDASPEEAFAYLADPANRAEWDPSVRVVETIDAGHGVGDRYAITIGFYGKAIETQCTVAELDPPTGIVFDVDGRVRGRDVIVITPHGEGSSIRLDTEVTLKGPARVLDRGLRLALAGIGENAAQGLEKALSGRRVP